MTQTYLPIIGPSSQPGESDGAELDYLRMPSEMAIYAAPEIPEADEVRGLMQGMAVLEQLLDQLRNYDEALNQPIAVQTLDEANRRLLDQVLGEGDVSIVVEGAPKTLIQESVLTSVWRVHSVDESGSVLSDHIEVATVPRIVREESFKGAKSAINSGLAPTISMESSPSSQEGARGWCEKDAKAQNVNSLNLSPPPNPLLQGGGIDRASIESVALPAGVMNAPPLLAEINEQIPRIKKSGGSHAINLSLLPQTEEDLLFLQTQLGAGRVAILSRGYGNCRITSTNTESVWWVQYFNSQDSMILNTLEISAVPEVACAAAEDIADSAQRLNEILEVYR